MNYKYNEKEYAEKIKKDGFQTRFIKYELVVLVKHLKELKYSKKKTEEFIYDFCKKHIQDYNEVKYYSTIDSAIRDGRKRDNKLIVVKDLPITISELEYIDNLNVDYDYKKLLLSFLVKRKIAYEVNKIHNGDNVELSAYFNGTKKTFRETFNSANIETKGRKIDDMISDLVELGIIQSIVKGDIVLSYIYDMYDLETEYVDVVNKLTKEIEKHEKKHIRYTVDKDNIFYKLNDFENVGYLFDYYKGDNKIKVCEGENCDVLLKLRSNNQKYCHACWKEKQLEWQRESMRKIRNNENVK